jgi:hypothetical protein
VSCRTQLENYNRDGAVKIVTQKAWLSITQDPEKEVKNEKEAAGAVIGSILSPLIDIGFAAAKEKAKQNAAKYKSSFVVSASGSGFWAGENKVKLPVLTIMRKATPTGGSEAEAMKLTLKPELSPDKTAFRYVVSTPLIYTYSTAKTTRDYDYIDVTLDIKFKALLVTKSQYEVKDLRATSIVIPALLPGSTSLPTEGLNPSGWLPFPAKPSLEVETDVTEHETKTVEEKGSKEGKNVNDRLVTNTKTLKKRAKETQTIKTNAGLYEFEITVTESNPYKIKAENKQQLIESTTDTSATFFKAIVDAIFKKEEEKEEETENQ